MYTLGETVLYHDVTSNILTNNNSGVLLALTGNNSGVLLRALSLIVGTIS
jgi:hypothetical protein